MTAPIGNKFWEQRSSHGTKPKFSSPEQLWSACLEYFQWVEDNPLMETKVFHSNGQITKTEVPKMRAMTIDGLCIFLGITDQTLYNYRDKSKDFLDVVREAERVIRTQKFTGAAADFLNPNIIARDLGLKDSTETRHSGEVTFTKIERKIVKPSTD